MSRRSVGAVVQWTESQSAAHPFEGAAIIVHPDNPDALLVAQTGDSEAEIVRHPGNPSSFMLGDSSEDPAALLMWSDGSVFLLSTD
jgi:hypothetical protein